MGAPGVGIAPIVSAAAGTIDPLFNASHAKNVVILWAGSNDLANGGGQEGMVYSAIKTFGAARKAVGWQVIVISILPRQAANGSFESDRQALRADLLSDFTTPTSDALIWSGASYADLLIDIGNDSDIGQSGQNVTGPYVSDQIHLADGGYQRVARKALKAVRMLH